MQTAALNLTTEQLVYLKKLLKQINNFKDHALSSVWLHPLATWNKDTGVFELYQDRATPENLKVIQKCMEAEERGDST